MRKKKLQSRRRAGVLLLEALMLLFRLAGLGEMEARALRARSPDFVRLQLHHVWH